MVREKQIATLKQVRANIDPNLDEKMTRAARQLGIHKKAFVADAIKAKLGKFDVDFLCKTLRAEKITLSVEKEQFRKERDAARRQRDCFKTKHEEAQESIAKLEADLEAYQARGFWDRVLNRPVKPWDSFVL